MNGTNKRKNGYLPIDDYGVIGNLHTIALVSKSDASIDHFCFPRFDSPLLFGRLLTKQGGGYFQIVPAECLTDWTSKQLYLPSSNVLITRFLGAAGGIGQVTDFLPVTAVPSPSESGLIDGLIKVAGSKSGRGSSSGTKRLDPSRGGTKCWPWLIRKVETVRGRIQYKMACQPAFDYGRQSHNAVVNGDSVTFANETMGINLNAYYHDNMPKLEFRISNESVNYPTGLNVELPKVETTFELNEHQSIYFLLRASDDDTTVSEKKITIHCLQNLLYGTNSFWHQWIAKCTYKGRWREIVQRSALVLKLLTFAPTGAIIAAPTTSLPEEMGGSKNWDYRFTWIRDAAFTVYAFLRIGLTEEAADFMKWIEERCREITSDPVGLRLMYDVNGRHPTVKTLEEDNSYNGVNGELISKGNNDNDSDDTTDSNTTTNSDNSKAKAKKNNRRRSISALAAELELNHWTGYCDSKPVRIGNLAAWQQQLDIYGELLDAIYLCDKWVKPISYDFWLVIRDKIIPFVANGWDKPDHGIWEARKKPEHHIYSKVMAWVAFDRVVRLAVKRSLPAPLVEWRTIRDQIYEDIMSKGYNEQLGVFTQYYGGESLDASNLIMPLVFFLPPDDPRFIRTLEKTMLPPSLGGLTSNHLVFRYHTPESPEGTFTICSFWLVEALARAGRRHGKFLEASVLMFEDIIGYANHLGLFSEQIGLDGSALGNFPQAFTHLSLISAAFNLDRALGQ